MGIADLIKSIIDSSKERMKSPIVGSFICSFLIYNWRPILLLLCSKESIEYNIIVINTWYCTLWSVVVPLIMVVVYTFGVPMLMVWVDTKLKRTKEKRIENIYESRIFTTKEKVKLAEEVTKLKNAESGNKQIDDLTKERDTMKESYEQRITSDKLTIENLNNSLKESNELVQKVLRSRGSYNIVDGEIYLDGTNKSLASFFNDLQKRHKEEIITYLNSKNSKFEDFSENLGKILSNAEVFKKNSSNEWYLTDKGMDLMTILGRPL